MHGRQTEIATLTDPEEGEAGRASRGRGWQTRRLQKSHHSCQSLMFNRQEQKSRDRGYMEENKVGDKRDETRKWIARRKDVKETETNEIKVRKQVNEEDK